MAGLNYVAEAFKLRGNLLFVGGGVLLSALLGSWGLFAIAAGLETAYLFGMASNPRFRRAIRARR